MSYQLFEEHHDFGFGVFALVCLFSLLRFALCDWAGLGPAVCFG